MAKKILNSLIYILVLWITVMPVVEAAIPNRPDLQTIQQLGTDENREAKEKYIIKFKNSDRARSEMEKHKKSPNDTSFSLFPSLLRIALSKEEAELIKMDSNVIYIEKDGIVSKAGDIITSNLNQIHIPEVYEEGISGNNVKVAIMDTGISQGISELKITDQVSFVANESVDDLNGHGTFMAGIISAKKNDKGLIGIAPSVNLYNIKVLDKEGYGTYSQVIKGIEWAINNKVDIISMSFTGDLNSSALEEVLQLAYDNGILLVAATGNGGNSNIAYPAKYSSVIAVGAVDSSNQLAPNSNTGPEIELVAPGVNIEGLSLLEDSYITMSGTSVAVPQVAGVAALIKEKYPYITNLDIRSRLDNHAKFLGEKNKFGYGLINAANALEIKEVEYDVQSNVLISKKTARYVPSSTITSNLSSVSNSVYFSGVTSSVYGISVTNTVYEQSVLDSVYSPNSYSIMASTADEYPMAYDQIALNNINLNTNQAPYSIKSGYESISTLTGGLSLQVDDITLPGRNGNSFTLKRLYNSNSSQLFDMDVEQKNVYHYRVYPYMNLVYDKQDVYGNTNYAFESDKMNQVNVGFYSPVPGQVIGQPKDYVHTFRDGAWISYHSGYYTCGNIIADKFADCYNDIYNQYKALASQLDFSSAFFGPSSEGYYYRQWAYYASPTTDTPQPLSAYLYTGYFNKVIERNYQENMFPIGKGWSWNINSIESKRGKKYLHLANNGSYEINSSNELIGYPWKDITLSINGSVSVNGENSYYELKFITGVSHYFNYEGRIIKISDAYGNSIYFKYSYDTPYGKALTGITNDLGNTINISYQNLDVVLTLGDRTVTYSKQKINGKEFLTSVKDPIGRTTKYSYNIYGAQFNFPSNTSANNPADNPYGLLSRIEHPTGANTNYYYESTPVTRYFGTIGYNQAYRIYQRNESTSDNQIYNRKTISYSGDIGINFSNSYHFSVTVDDGLKQTKFTNYKQYVSDTIPAVYYNTEIAEFANSKQKITTMEYDQIKHLPNPIVTTVKYVNNSSVSNNINFKQSYDEFGNILTSTNPLNVTTHYSYDNTKHMLESVSQPIDEELTRFVYYERNMQGSLTKIAVKENNSSGALHSETEYEYDNYGNVILVKIRDDNRIFEINNEYSSLYGGAYLTGQYQNLHDADGSLSYYTVSMEYNNITGELINYLDGKGNRTSYEYDKLGRPIKITYADNSVYQLIYNDAENSVKSIDQTGLTNYSKWNALGWKTSQGIVGNGITSYGYDQFGRLKWSEDAKSNRTNLDYDDWGRLIKTIYADGSSSSVVYDDVNQVKTSIDQATNKIQETYNINGNLIKTELSKNSNMITTGLYTYDYAGNITSSTDGNSNTTKYSYDVLNRLTSVTDAEGQITKYKYSLAGKLIETQFPDGSVEKKQYNEQGRPTRKTDPAGKTEKYYYDLNGNISVYKDHNFNNHYYTYNIRNYLVDYSIYSISEDIYTQLVRTSYSYDAAGRRLTMSDETGLSSYEYDGQTKFLKSLTYPDGKKVSYQYDNLGNRTEMTDPFGLTTAYSYDSRNRLVGVGSVRNDWDATYTYKTNSLLETDKIKNGITSTYGYEATNLVSLTQNKTVLQLNNYSYEYDNSANLIRRGENGNYSSFEYDKLNRIRSSSQFNELYTYDDNGNRKTSSSNNLMMSTRRNYQFDALNRLKKVVTDTGHEMISYKYNGEGLLYERTEEGKTTRFYYDGMNVIAEGTVNNNNSTLKASYIRGNKLVARTDSSGNKAYYLHNGHGDVIGLLDGAGDWVNKYSYDIWGSPTYTMNTENSQPFRYNGEFWDSSANLQYLRARWYDPSIGRFVSKDTYEGDITNPLSLNLYTYVENNPLKFRDPTGHMKDSFGAALPMPTGNQNPAPFIQTAQNNWWAAQGHINNINAGIATGLTCSGCNDVSTWSKYQDSMHAWAEKVRSGQKVAESISVKLEGSASVFAGAKLGAEVKGNTLKLYFTGSSGGSVGGGGGLMVNHTLSTDLNGKMSSETSNLGVSGGRILIGEFTYKSDQKYVELSQGIGLGGGISMDVLPLGASFEKEYSISPELPFSVTSNETITIYPAYNGAPSYAEWANMFGGGGW